jgi:hypothetical protein
VTASLTKKFETVAFGFNDRDRSGNQDGFTGKIQGLETEKSLKLPTLISTLRVDDKSPRMFAHKQASI